MAFQCSKEIPVTFTCIGILVFIILWCIGASRYSTQITNEPGDRDKARGKMLNLVFHKGAITFYILWILITWLSVSICVRDRSKWIQFDEELLSDLTSSNLENLSNIW